MSKLNYSYHRFLNNNRNKGIPNLMLWICIGNALVYFLSQFGTPLSLYSALSFDPQAIAHGQVWRLFSYIFTFAGIGDMSIYSIFSVALALYCSYWPARYLEQLWGSLRVNLYYLIGILAMDVYAMLVYFLFHVSYGVSALYLNLSMFLSVAALMPEARGLLFFFIPVKMRWLALVDIGGILYYLVKDILEAVRFWTLYGSALLGIGLILVAFLPIVAQLPCLLFCWHELPQLLNILTGSLHIVSYRPSLYNQTDLIRERDRCGLHQLRPGLTGWAQIHGRDELEIQEKAALDRYYLEHLGPAIDLKCFFGTFLAVFRQSGVVEGGTGAMERRDRKETR